jgi:mitochondrial cardiolipin hydrolase
MSIGKADFFHSFAGIKIVHDNSSYHMHHKFCIVDGKKLLNGSLNWSVQGVTSNQENVMVTTNLVFVKSFQVRFDRMWAQFGSNVIR